MSNIICPVCNGYKQVFRQVFPTVLSGWHPCRVCEAIGFITEKRQAIFDLGKMVRSTRIASGLTMREIADENNFTVSEWLAIENGESTLEETRHALLIAEGLSVQMQDKFDVIFHETASKSEKLDTFDTKEEAEQKIKDCKVNLRNLGVIGAFTIIPRKERTIQ